MSEQREITTADVCSGASTGASQGKEQDLERCKETGSHGCPKLAPFCMNQSPGNLRGQKTIISLFTPLCLVFLCALSFREKLVGGGKKNKKQRKHFASSTVFSVNSQSTLDIILQLN